MKHFSSVILLALSFVIFVGCGNQNTVVVKGQYDAPTSIIRQEPMVERSVGHRPLSVATVHNDQNEKFSLTMYVLLRSRDQEAFDRAYEQRMHQVIDRIETIMRVATPEERMEMTLITIRERAKQEINEILGTPWVQEVFISNVTIETN